MTLGDVIEQLKYGELRAIATKDDNLAIVSYTNLALQALYNRFLIKVSETIIQLEDNITEYTLPDDVAVIDSVYNENGEELSIDDPSDINGVFRSSFDTIQVPNPITGNALSIIYVAIPEKLTYIDETSLTQKIPLPPQLLEPLLHYIGYRAHMSINGDIKEENNTHYIRFVASCDRIDQLGAIRRAIPLASVSKAEHISETYTEMIGE
jgi:hypothetical protein